MRMRCGMGRVPRGCHMTITDFRKILGTAHDGGHFVALARWATWGTNSRAVPINFATTVVRHEGCGHDHGHDHDDKRHTYSIALNWLFCPGIVVYPVIKITPTRKRLHRQKTWEHDWLHDIVLNALTGSILLIGAKATKLLVPVLYKMVFDQMMENTGTQNFLMVISLICAHVAARTLSEGLNSLNNILFARSAQKVTEDLGRKALAHLVDLDLNYHMKSSVGAITRKVERGMRATTTVLSRIFMHLTPQFIELCIVTYIIQVKAGTTMAAGALATVVLYALFTLRTVQERNRYVRKMNEEDNKSTASIIETLQNQETVKAFNRQSHQVDKYGVTLRSYLRAQLKSTATLAKLNFGQRTIEAVGQGTLLLRTAMLCMTGEITIGDLLMVNALLAQLMGPLDHLGANYMQLSQGLIDGKELFKLYKAPSQVVESKDAVDLRPCGGSLRFENVTFGFRDDQRNTTVFDRFDLTIPAGKTVAIVGESGCGKSTLSRLAVRGYDVDTGRVLVDDQDVRGLTLDSLRKAVGVAPQDSRIFNEDIIYNLRYGSPNATLDDIKSITSIVQLEEDLAGMPEGLSSSVGDRGGRLSGGQRQRVGLGRALLVDPDILICDEVTSSLDVATEARLMKELMRVRDKKTTILIAHRLSTVTQADEIIVLQGGRIAERGTHQQLLRQPGSIYKSMWNQQLEASWSVHHDHDHDHDHSHGHPHDHSHDHHGSATGSAHNHANSCCGHDH
ncbi:hypothetical protein AAMO2058_000727000 [Amorphochlora amoebiformis]